MNMLHRHTEPCTIGAYIHKNKGQKIEMIQQKKYVLKSLYKNHRCDSTPTLITHHINMNEKLTKMNALKIRKANQSN